MPILNFQQFQRLEKVTGNAQDAQKHLPIIES